jgi:hypothetical protein
MLDAVEFGKRFLAVADAKDRAAYLDFYAKDAVLQVNLWPACEGRDEGIAKFVDDVLLSLNLKHIVQGGFSNGTNMICHHGIVENTMAPGRTAPYKYMQMIELDDSGKIKSLVLSCDISPVNDLTIQLEKEEQEKQA